MLDIVLIFKYSVLINEDYSTHRVRTKKIKNCGVLNLADELNEEQKNGNFVQMYRDHMPEIRWLMKKSGIASSILNFIMEHMDGKNALCCSYTVFMDYFEVSKDTIRRSIKLLKDSGFIDVLKSGTSNVYIVNKEVAWTSYGGKQKQSCKFDGNILVSKTENKDYFYRSQFDKFKELREREGIK